MSTNSQVEWQDLPYSPPPPSRVLLHVQVCGCVSLAFCMCVRVRTWSSHAPVVVSVHCTSQHAAWDHIFSSCSPHLQLAETRFHSRREPLPNNLGSHTVKICSRKKKSDRPGFFISNVLLCDPFFIQEALLLPF